MTAQRIVRPATAFSVASTKQRRPREQNPKHLKWIGTLRCCVCGKPGPDAAHVRAANPVIGKRETGKGEKASDKWTVPLCREHHTEQHSMNELLWWASKGLDPFGMSLALYDCSGDDEMADAILSANIARARR